MTRRRLAALAVLGLAFLAMLAWWLAPDLPSSSSRASAAPAPARRGALPPVEEALGEERPCGISGAAVLAEGGPARGATVSLVQQIDFHDVATWERTTDAGGRFAFEDLPFGWYLLDARLEGRVPAGTKTRHCAGDGEVHEVTLSLVAGDVELVGSVLGADGAPVPGAVVTVYQAGGDVIVGYPRLPVGPDGRFRAALSEGDAFRVQGTAEGYLFDSVDVDAIGERVTVDLRLVRQPRIVGRLVDLEGRPVDKARLYLGPATRALRVDERSNADGRFEIESREGDVVVSAHGGDRFVCREVEGIGEGEEVDLGTLAMEPGRVVAGQVPEPRPEGLRIGWRQQACGLFELVDVAPDGRFAFRGVPDAGVELFFVPNEERRSPIHLPPGDVTDLEPTP